MNKYLDVLNAKVLDIEKKSTYVWRFFSNDIKNILTCKNGIKRFLIPIFEEHNNKMEKLLGKEYAPATLKNFKTCLAHLKSFL